jgi:hypothetical protein
MKSILTWLACGVALATSAVAAPAADLSPPLLVIDASVCLGVKFCGPYETHVAIAADGLTVADSIFKPLAVAPFLSTLGSGTGTPHEFGTLARFLAVDRIGLQGGNCTIGNNPTTLGGSIDVTWYGRGAFRSNHFVVSFDRGQPTRPLCSAQLEELIAAIETYVVEATGVQLLPLP